MTADSAAPTLLFLPGSYSTGAAWKGVQAALSGRYRMVLASLPGYPGTPEMRAPGAADMEALAGWAEAEVARAGGPVHLIAHSFGGLTALAAALRGRAPVASLVTFEANPVYARRAAGAFPWLPALEETYRRFRAAVEAGDPSAPGIIIDYWGKPGDFAALPEAVRAFCSAHAEVNLRDWHCARGFTVPFGTFAALGIPATIARGEHANPAIADVSAELAAHLPQAALKVVPGAGHSLIATHPRDCAAIIDAHMAGVPG